MDELIERLRARADEERSVPERERSELIRLLIEAADALEAAQVDGARLRETLRDVTGVAICGLFDTHREDTLREFSPQELSRVVEAVAPLREEGVTVESVYRRGYDAAIDRPEYIDAQAQARTNPSATRNHRHD